MLKKRKAIVKLSTIEWTGTSIKLIDQNKLPRKLDFIYCKNIESLYRAIKDMTIRGAPALGVAGAFGVILAVIDSKADTSKQLSEDLKKAIKYLKTSRPTAVNLFWSLDRMWNKFKTLANKKIPEIKKLLYQEALEILNEDKEVCRAIGEHGLDIIENNDNILTHCNAGALATADYGTALGVFYSAVENGKSIHIYVDETRPKLQGARLTCWELGYNNIPYTLICDNMAADLMRKKKIDKIIVGADRIALNGDTANKIGTYSLAVLADFHNIPFYIAAPLSTFDLNICSGGAIDIEQRDKEEVLNIEDNQIAPFDSKVYNPAFDITPSDLITGIITNKGIIRPLFKKNIKNIFNI